jgi:hypothetical protein
MTISRTQSIEIAAPREAVFDVVSRAERLPEWATAFCRAVLGREGERLRIETPQGPMLFWIDADARRGIVDMHGGPSEAEASYWPARVLEAPGGRSVFVFTAFRAPGMSDAEFDGQCAALGHELATLKALVETGRGAG